MKFTHLPAVAHFINKYHYAFGDGCQPIYKTLSILCDMNALMMKYNAIVSVTFPAWQHVPTLGILKSFITIQRDQYGFWDVTESTKSNAFTRFTSVIAFDSLLGKNTVFPYSLRERMVIS